MALVANQRVFIPKTLNDALNILRRRPECIVSAGATHLSLQKDPLPEDRDIVSLAYVEELSRVFRSDRYVDIGAMVSLEKMYDLSTHVVPRGVRQTVKDIGTPQVRSLATLGGNICAGAHHLGLLPILILNDSKIELRRSGASRWIPAGRLLDQDGSPALQPGEIVTRIRIPLDRWNIQETRRLELGRGFGGKDFSFCALGAVHQNSIEDLRISICLGGARILQSRTSDAELVGKKLPLSTRDVSQYTATLLTALELPQEYKTSFLEHRIRNLAAAFLFSLNRD